MTHGPLNRVLDNLQRTVEPADDGESDARLMQQFIGQADGHAFAALVRRHGPMVYGVCRRVLGNADDAEDVFQATFLVLVRKARSLRRLASVGSWLYGVAYRTALEARRAMAKRRAKEALAPSHAAAADETAMNELRAVLDHELARLPERYRQVVVLCDLEGQGRKEAARRIGCPEGTVASRLAKARTLLAARLARHGLPFSAAALATTLAAEAASASVPAAWLPATVRAARQFAGATAGAVSTEVVSLVQGVCRTMLVKKLTTIGAILLVVVLAGFGAGTAYFQAATAGPPGDDTANAAAAQGKAGDARQELARLKDELRALRSKAATLVARVAELEREQPEVLYRGKPASYWTKALRDRDPKYRGEALIALGGIAEVDRSVIPTIMTALMNDTVPDVRVMAAMQLAGTRGDQPGAAVGVLTEALPPLIAALKDTKQQHRTWAMYAIGLCGEEARPAVGPLTALLKSRSRTDRIISAQVLGQIGPNAAAAVPALIELLQGPSKAESYVAAWALGQIGPSAKAAVPPLIAMLDDTQPQIFPFDRSLQPMFTNAFEFNPAADAATALGQIGLAAKAALPALRAVHDQRVTAAARAAIQKIESAVAEKK